MRKKRVDCYKHMMLARCDRGNTPHDESGSASNKKLSFTLQHFFSLVLEISWSVLSLCRAKVLHHGIVFQLQGDLAFPIPQCSDWCLNYYFCFLNWVLLLKLSSIF